MWITCHFGGKLLALSAFCANFASIYHNTMDNERPLILISNDDGLWHQLRG